MEKKEKQLTETESFELIQKMISSAKEEMEDDSFYYLIWGWLVFVASISQFVMIRMNVEMNFLGWLILMPAGALATILYSRRQEKKQRVKTYVDWIMKYVGIAFMVALFIVLFFQFKLQLNAYPMIMMVYGMWLFVSGASIKFKPIIIGGIINWILCIASFFFAVEIQILILASAVMLGYIIPGHMLKNKFENLKS
ncbi:MAG: hypothetical protein NT126_02630 [Bacteroidetes bacterium]|nr:hypothetical protein [Bacteroidota bacterium]